MESIRQWLGRARAVLAPASASPGLDAEIVLAHALGRDRAWLLGHPEDIVPADARCRADQWLQRRRGGEPLAYITGRREFWSLDLEVTPDTLIPRPETETLVERALELLPPDADRRVLDLGTGSGAIAIAVASERPRAEVTATDASLAALVVAKRNAERLVPGRVGFVASDWFAALGSASFDLIVSNPPYVAAADPALADAAIRHEPGAALVAGRDGFDALRHIAAGLLLHLAPGGRVLLEHGAMQAADVAGILAGQGLEVIACRRDLAGTDRVTEARLPDAADEKQRRD